MRLRRSVSSSSGTSMVNGRIARSSPAPASAVSDLAEAEASMCLCAGGEEVDKQLVDAFRLVVMHPVRGVGQALHAVEVGYVVAVGLGEFGAEVGIALPPDDQRRRRDRAKLCRGFLLGLPYRGAVVVDHPGRCPWLRPRLDVAFELLVGVRGLCLFEE